jgi:hypothetical protein
MRLEVPAVERRRNGLEVARFLIVVKYIADTRRTLVGRSEATQPEVVLDVLEDAAELVLCMRNVAPLAT